MIFILAVMVIIFFCIYHRIVNRRKYKLGNKFPGPPNFLFFGSLIRILNRKNVMDLFQFLNAGYNRYGGIYRIWLGLKLTFMVSDPKLIELVLNSQTKNVSKSNFYDILMPFLGDGLLLSKGQKWHNRRKALTPAFHFKILEKFIKIFENNSQILVNQLKPKADGQMVDMHNYISLTTLDIICEAAMDTKINAQTDKQSAYVKSLQEATLILSSRFNETWKRNEFLFRLFANKTKQKQNKAIEVMHNFTRKIIQTRREKIIDLDNKNETINDIKQNKKMVLLDILLKTKINDYLLTDADIKEEVDTFMFEGHDTTTSAICFTLYLLSKHNDVQNKVFTEVNEVFGTNVSATYSKLQDLKYLELVIKESLRLYPSVPIIGRRIEEELKIDEHRNIPANVDLIIDLYHMFRDPTLFSNPNAFIPERFSPENSFENKSPYAFIPFSAGSRNCIGQKFAMLEIKCLISKIILNYKLLAIGPEPELEIALILKSANGIYLGMKSR